MASFLDVLPRPGADLTRATLDNYAAILTSTNFSALRNSLIIATGGTALSMGLGCALALLAARTDVPLKPIVQIAGIVPLFMTSLVGALAWASLASPRQGYLNILLREFGIPATLNVYSLGGIVFVLGLYYTPYVYLFVHSALVLIDPEHEDAGVVHGASLVGVLRRITFPLVTPAIIGSALLTFVLMIENFSVPQVLGAPARLYALPSRMFRLMNTSPTQPNVAAAMGIVLMVIMVALIWGQRRIITRRQYTTVTGKGFRPRRIALGKWRWPAFGLVAVYLLLSVIMPVFALGQNAFRPFAYADRLGDLLTLEHLTLSKVTTVLQSGTFELSLRNSFTIGIAAAVLGAVLHMTMSYAVYRSKIRGRQAIEYVAMAPLAIPALLMGMGYLWTWLPLPLPIYGTITIFVLAYISRFMPQGFRGASASILSVHKDLEESAFLSGASRLRATLYVTVPLIRSGVVATMLLLLMLSMRELSAALFLFTTDTRVLSIVIYDYWESGRFDMAATVSLIYSAILLVVALVGRKWLSVGGQ